MTYKAVDLDAALARLAAEVEPGPGLKARVLADAAMVSAERRPLAVAPARKKRSLAWLTAWPTLGLGGALAAAALALVVGFGGLDVLDGGQQQPLTADHLAALDEIEREVIATLDDDFFDAPL